LRPGDLITRIDDQPMQSAQEALSYVARLAPGATVRIRGLRRGERFDMRAEVVERGQPPPT
jgi:serine protease DegS